MPTQKERTAISPTREEDFPEWYQQVTRAADLAEGSQVRGCMVIKPWGYGIWESIQSQLDARIKETGHSNAYFPLFIPLSFLQREAEHVEGFAKECAVVTHHRLELKDGKLVPSGELEEPLIVRPTSETIIGDTFSRWVQSHRDLPLKINQWANVVRWEMRPRLFLRTAEFLWQEGHTVHATKEEAVEETLLILELYRDFVENVLAIPLIVGEKSPGERFPGADNTYCFEAMMQDGKALQGGTSHYLGQNFAKACGIRFNNENEELQYGYSTSWGVTTRLIGGLIMVHGDDDGIRLPPRIAPQQAVILPIYRNDQEREQVLAAAEMLRKELRDRNYHGRPIEIHIDDRDLRGGEKNWQWIKRGVPLRIELGPRDLEKQHVMVARRDKAHKEKQAISFADLPGRLPVILDEIQDNLYTQARSFREAKMVELTDKEEMIRFFTPKNPDKPEIHGGFVKTKWCGDPETEADFAKWKLSIRCIPLEQSGTEGKCILTGRPASLDVIVAKSY